jgi:hypothetical protein
MSGSNNPPQYGEPEFEDVILVDVGSLKTALQNAETLTEAQLEAVFNAAPKTGGSW